MTTLVIFDNNINKKAISKLKKHDTSTIHVFSLTSNTTIIENINKTFPNNSILNSAKIINEEVTLLQNNIHKWCSDLGNKHIQNKTIKEWFLLPDKQVSTWWFGLLAEKNTNQDIVFFQLAQINAIKKTLLSNSYSAVLINVSDQRLASIITHIVRNLNSQIRIISQKSLSFYTHKFLSCIEPLLSLIKSCMILMKWICYSFFIRIILASQKKRLATKSDFLFVSYFPHIDEESAKKGIFINKYASALQFKLKDLAIPVTWLLMPVKYNHYNFKSAIKLAKLLAQKGERIFVLYEFFTFKMLCVVLYLWIRQCFLSFYVYSYLEKKSLMTPITTRESIPLFHYLWRHSFLGPSGMRGILFYLTFRNIFKILGPKRCLYYSEMQAWEKALNAAKKSIQPQTETLGFQHTVAIKNLFHYFYDKNDLSQKHISTDLPLPNKLIANGKFPYSVFQEYQFTNVWEAEAVRQLYLNKIIDQPLEKKPTKPILLVIGTLSTQETRALISMIHSAFPKADNFEIWFKSHPLTPIESLFEHLRIDILNSKYKVCSGDVSQFLKVANMVFVSGSTIALEAIAYGCKVVIPVLPDFMQVSPLVDYQSNYYLANTTSELKIIIQREIFHQNESSSCIKSFINNYWHLDPKLPRWEKILSENSFA